MKFVALLGCLLVFAAQAREDYFDFNDDGNVFSCHFLACSEHTGVCLDCPRRLFEMAKFGTKAVAEQSEKFSDAAKHFPPGGRRLSALLCCKGK